MQTNQPRNQNIKEIGLKMPKSKTLLGWFSGANFFPLYHWWVCKHTSTLYNVLLLINTRLKRNSKCRARSVFILYFLFHLTWFVCTNGNDNYTQSTQHQLNFIVWHLVCAVAVCIHIFSPVRASFSVLLPLFLRFVVNSVYLLCVCSHGHKNETQNILVDMLLIVTWFGRV